MRCVMPARPAWMMMLLFATLLSLSGWGCAGRRTYEDLPMEEAWARITSLYNREKYIDASERLEVFVINYTGSTLADSAQFLLGECHYNLKEYIIAGSEYQKLISQYPRSPLVEEAEYKLGMSHYELSPSYHKDQEYTTKAIEVFQQFIEDFPDSEFADDATTRIEELRNKLARKEFQAGRLYQRMKENQAARIYYQSVLDNYYDSPYADDSQFYKAMTWIDDKKWNEAIAGLNAFLGRYPDSEFAGRAHNYLEYAQAELEDK